MSAKDRKQEIVRPSRWVWLMPSCLLVLFASPVGVARIADHLYWGVISHSRVYVEPTDINPLYVFQIELETDQSVDHVEFLTAAARAYTIPPDASTVVGNVETYHESWGDVDVWGYWAFFGDPGEMDDYGDGLYTVTLHYADTTVEQADVWYGDPDTSYAMAEPVQKPSLTAPGQDDAVASPVTFTWERCIDPNVYDIYLTVTDLNDDAVADELFDVHATSSEPYAIDEGWYDVKFAFENYWPSYDDSGEIPFDLIKSNVAMHRFEAAYSSVYRFWSAATGRHFYTASASEKDKLVEKYAYAWAYEGTTFHACATEYYAGLAPVYRFWSDAAGSHFYTISEAEKNKLVGNYSHVWVYEGPVFYAYPNGAQPPEAKPVYRFYKPGDGTHFYTASESEADKLLGEFSSVYVYEGIAYYAYE